MTFIQSVQNPRVKAWTQLLTKRGREEQQRFVVEGVHLVMEALRSGADVETVLLAQGWRVPEELLALLTGAVERGQASGGALTDAVERAKVSGGALAGGVERGQVSGGTVPGAVELVEVSGAVLAKCTDTATPQGVAAVIRKPELAAADLLDTADSLVVAVDGVQDPGNVGTIVRSADAVGATAVLLGRGTVDLYNPKTVRATMGSLFHLPVMPCDLDDLLPQAAARGIRVVSTSLSADRPCYELDLSQPTWIVVGNEGSGVSPALERHVTDRTIIPMHGQAESLNVAMATTVLLYEALRQRKFSTNKNS